MKRILLAMFIAAGAARAEGLSLAASAQGGEVFPSVIYSNGSNYGLGIGVDYEWQHARAGATAFFGGGGAWGSFALRADAAWLPLEGSWSPYLGAGAGLIFLGEKRPRDPYNDGLGPSYMEMLPLTSAEAGVEFLRDRRIHLLAGAQLDLPWSDPFTGSGYTLKVRYPIASATVRLVF